MHFAAATGHLDCLQWLCSDEVGQRLTGVAVFCMCSSSAVCFSSSTASNPKARGNPHDIDVNGTTPLYFAAQGMEQAVRWAQGRLGKPLAYAQSFLKLAEGHLECVEWLLVHCGVEPLGQVRWPSDSLDRAGDTL